MTTPPAGWYSNPEAPGVRYWDGVQWTEHVAAAAPTPVPAPAPAPAPQYGVMAAPPTPPGYPTNGLYQAMTTPTSNKKASTALTLAIISLLLNPLMILSILAIVFGAQGKAQADEYQRAGYGRIGGAQSAWAIGLGIAGAIIFIIVFTNTVNNL